MRTISLPLIGLLVLFASCTDDGVARDPPPLDPGILPDATVVDPDPMEGCPDTQPKVGENCSPGITESNQCEFVTGECLAPNGSSYVETINFCCKTGVWETCGGRSPCEGMEVLDAAQPTPVVDAAVADAPVVDAGVVDAAVTDANPDASDGGVD